MARNMNAIAKSTDEKGREVEGMPVSDRVQRQLRMWAISRPVSGAGTPRAGTNLGRKRRSGVGRRLDAASDFDRTWREEENASSILMIAGG